MLSVEDWAEIRRLRRAEGLPIKVIARLRGETDLAQRNYVDPSAGDRVRLRTHAARWLAGRTVERATAAFTGLRWGECAGLFWEAVDLDARRLRVVRVLVEVSGQITVKPYPKSRAGRRSVPVPSAVVELLAAHRVAYPSPGLVFTNSVGGRVGRTSFRTRVWKPALRRAGLPEGLRFHDLRHSYATWLVSDGVPPNVVQRIMGHEDVTTTLGIYTDVPADFVQRVEDALVVDPLSIRPVDEPGDEDDALEEGP